MESAANALHGDVVTGLDELVAGGECQRGRQGHGAHVAEGLHRGVVAGVVEVEDLEQGALVLNSDLVGHDAVHVSGSPAQLLQEGRPGPRGESVASVQEGLGVGVHEGPA